MPKQNTKTCCAENDRVSSEGATEKTMRAVVVRRSAALAARRCWLSTDAAAAAPAETEAKAAEPVDLVPPIAKRPLPRKFADRTVEYYNKRAYKAAVDARRLLYRTEWLEQQRLKAVAFTLKRDQQLKESAAAQAERTLRKEERKRAKQRELARTREEREQHAAALQRNSLKKQALHRLEQDVYKLHQLRFLEAEQRSRWVDPEGERLTPENVFSAANRARLVGWWPRASAAGSTGVGAGAVVSDPLDVVPTVQHGDPVSIGKV